MLEKCCHDIDFYSMITKSRPIKVASFGSRRSFIPENLPEGSHEQYTKDRLKGWESKSNVFDSDADICLLYTSPSPRDATLSRMPSSA